MANNMTHVFMSRFYPYNVPYRGMDIKVGYGVKQIIQLALRPMKGALWHITTCVLQQIDERLPVHPP